MEEATLAGVVIIIMGMIEAFKLAGFPKKYSALLALVFGVIGMIAVALQTGSQDYVGAIKAGLIVGLMSAGLYSSTKPVVKNLLRMARK